MPTRFSFDQYGRNPAYPGVIEARLTTTPIPATNAYDLSQYAEPTFPGYARKTGSRDSLFFPPTVGTDTVNLITRPLVWRASSGFPISVRGMLLVATLPGEASELVGIIPCEGTLTDGIPTICFSATCITSRVIL